MNYLSIGGRFSIILCTLGAMVLSIIALPSWYHLFRPEWVLVLVIYWSLKMPQHVNLSYVAFLGILLDVMYGQYLGLNMLSLSAAAYLSILVRQHFGTLVTFQAMLWGGLLTLLHLIIVHWLANLSDPIVFDAGRFLRVLSTILCLPFIFAMMDSMTAKYR